MSSSRRRPFASGAVNPSCSTEWNLCQQTVVHTTKFYASSARQIYVSINTHFSHFVGDRQYKSCEEHYPDENQLIQECFTVYAQTFVSTQSDGWLVQRLILLVRNLFVSVISHPVLFLFRVLVVMKVKPRDECSGVPSVLQGRSVPLESMFQ